MKTIPTITLIALCGMPLAFADEAPAKPVEGREIVRPIGRVGPVQDVDAEPQTEAIPEKHAEHEQIAIVFEDLERVGERLAMRASLRIINPTDKPITFTGYSETSPITKEQHWKDGEWVEKKKILRCGTGLRQCTIAPGQSAVFTATVYAETMPTRIGITYKGEDKELKTVWSGKIER